MSTVEVIGTVNEAGELQVGKVHGLHAGKVRVVISEIVSVAEDDEPLSVEPTWTDEELAELLKPVPGTGADIVRMITSGELDTSSWSHITDSVQWVEDLRRRAWRNPNRDEE